MESVENKGLVYEFGKFILDPEEKTLLADGTPIRLPSKEFETLLLLVENNGKALSKDEMIAFLWQDSFVEEGSLAKQISRLRKILNANGEQFIETLPKHGYRFLADLRRTIRTPEEPVILEKRTARKMTVAFESDDQPKARALLKSKPRFSRGWAAAFAGLISILIAGSVWLGYQKWFSENKRIDSIAVLPLRSLSPQDDDRVLRLGLTDSLITKLAGLRQMVVRPIGTVAAYSDGEHDPVEIGRRLNVDAVLEGTILRSDGRLRVNVRLLNTESGEQIWADKFDGEFTNIFDVEDRMSEQAARALAKKLTGDERERLTRRYTENAEAFDAYLTGRYFWNKRTEEGFRKSIEYFDQAVEKDPGYALAYAGKADSYILLGIWGALPPNETMPRAKDAATRALSADESLAEAHTSMAFIKWVYDWDWASADEKFGRALELDPNYSTAHQWRAYYLASQKRFNEAIIHIKRAQELEGPLSFSINTDIGEIYSWAGQNDKAIEQLREVIRIEPNFAIARNTLGMALIKNGRIGEAIAELEAARNLDNGPRMASTLGHAYGISGRHDEARKIIRELEATARDRYVSAFAIAVVYAGLGEQDAAIEWLEKARLERSDTMTILSVYPLLDSLRTNPDFTSLQQRVGR